MNKPSANKNVMLIQIRIWLIINYFSLILMIVMFYRPDILTINKLFLSLILLPLGSLIVSFIIIFQRTGLWGLTHKKLNCIGGDQLREYYNAIRISYSIFAILIIALLFIFSIFEIKVNVILAAALLYVAHILPASVMAWSNN